MECKSCLDLRTRLEKSENMRKKLREAMEMIRGRVEEAERMAIGFEQLQAEVEKQKALLSKEKENSATETKKMKIAADKIAEDALAECAKLVADVEREKQMASQRAEVAAKEASQQLEDARAEVKRCNEQIRASNKKLKEQAEELKKCRQLVKVTEKKLLESESETAKCRIQVANVEEAVKEKEVNWERARTAEKQRMAACIQSLLSHLAQGQQISEGPQETDQVIAALETAVLAMIQQVQKLQEELQRKREATSHSQQQETCCAESSSGSENEKEFSVEVGHSLESKSQEVTISSPTVSHSQSHESNALAERDKAMACLHQILHHPIYRFVSGSSPESSSLLRPISPTLPAIAIPLLPSQPAGPQQQQQQDEDGSAQLGSHGSKGSMLQARGDDNDCLDTAMDDYGPVGNRGEKMLPVIQSGEQVSVAAMDSSETALLGEHSMVRAENDDAMIVEAMDGVEERAGLMPVEGVQDLPAAKVADSQRVELIPSAAISADANIVDMWAAMSVSGLDSSGREKTLEECMEAAARIGDHSCRSDSWQAAMDFAYLLLTWSQMTPLWLLPILASLLQSCPPLSSALQALLYSPLTQKNALLYSFKKVCITSLHPSSSSLTSPLLCNSLSSNRQPWHHLPPSTATSISSDRSVSRQPWTPP